MRWSAVVAAAVLTLGVLIVVAIRSSVAKQRAGTDATAPAVLVVMERTGGIMGVNDRVEVKTDGSYTATPRSQTYTGTVGRTQLRELVEVVDEVGTQVPENSYTSDVFDDFQYRIVVGDRTIEGAGTALPHELRLLVRRLERLLAG